MIRIISQFRKHGFKAFMIRLKQKNEYSILVRMVSGNV